MIAANELRIGNLLQGNQIVKVTAILEKKSVKIEGNISTFSVEGKTPCLTPIPLTEDILLKCGFDVSTSADMYDRDVYSIQIENSRSLCFYNCEVTKMETGEKTIVSTWFFDYEWEHSVTNDGDSFWNRPKYLHQLQNLYFSLTGEELNVEL